MSSLQTLIFVLLGSIIAAKLSKTESNSEKSVESLQKFGVIDSPFENRFTMESLKNFDKVLDSVLHYSDFQPLAIAVGQFGSHSSENNRIAMKLLRRRFIDCYQYNVEEFSKGWKVLADGLTWIILIESQEVLIAKMKEIENFWRSETRYVIFCLNDCEVSDDWKIRLFRYVWENGAVSRILIFLLKENFRYVYRHLPFTKLDKKYGSVQKMDMEKEVCVDSEMVDPTTKSSTKLPCPWGRSRYPNEERLIFEDFKNLNGYPISVTVFPSLMMEITTNEKNEKTYDKLDANVMKLLEKRMSAVFDIHVLPERKNIDRFEAAIRRFDTDPDSQFIFTGYLTKFYSQGNHQFTAATLEDKLCVVVRSSKPVPKYFFPLLPFSTELWFLLILYNVVIAVLWLAIRRLESYFRDKKSTDRIEPKIELSVSMKEGLKQRRARFLGYQTYQTSEMAKLSKINVLAKLDRIRIVKEPPGIPNGLLQFFNLMIIAGSPLTGGKTMPERFFLFGTLFFGLIVVGLYESYLVSSLSKSLYYPQIESLQQVADSNGSIVSKYENLMRDIPTDGTPALEKIRTKLQILNTDVKTYDMVAFRGTMSLARYSSFKLENLSAYLDPETNRLMLHMVEECPATYSLAYVAHQNSPYVERIDRLILRMQQAGLIGMWYQDMLETMKMVEIRAKLKRGDERTKLTLAHISLTLVLLGVGLFISTLIFLGEIYCATKFRSPVTRLMLKRKTKQNKNSINSQ